MVYRNSPSPQNPEENVIHLAICGMPGAGKGEVTAKALEMGIPVYSMGDLVREWFDIEFTDRPEEETGLFADEERRKHGQDIWALRLIDSVKADKSESPIVIIDGLRSLQEASLFRAKLGPRFRIMAIHSSPTTRFNRLSKRGRSDDPRDLTKFKERDERELGLGLGNVIAMADIMILNEGTITDLAYKAEDIFKLMRWVG
jgi:dephospho-CoA kinase